MSTHQARPTSVAILAGALAFAVAVPLTAQTTDDPFPEPIPERDGAVVVDFVELATIPDFEGSAPRMMLLIDEPDTDRMFLADMWGVLYSISYDGQTVEEYLDLTDSRWDFEVQSRGQERGLQSFAFHPDFGDEGSPGYGKFYTYVDVVETSPPADFTPPGGQDSHDTVLLEWTAESADAATYDGGPPREVMRFEQPFGNHNAGHLAFNPLASPGDDDYGILYMGVADGGSGGDPMDLSQDLRSAFGKVFRIDPLGSDAANGEYGIPEDNPYADDGDPETLDEIWVSGVRNPQRFNWDPANGNLFVADIGQNIVEELSLMTSGDDLGWNDWEGSFRFIGREAVGTEDPRGDPDLVYPVAEYGHGDPVLLPRRRAAITGVHVYRDGPVEELRDLVIFGDNPAGELFYIPADDLPEGGESAIRRILLNDDGEAKTLVDVVQEKMDEQGRGETTDQADVRFGHGPDGQLLLLNKFDGVVRLVVPGEGGAG